MIKESKNEMHEYTFSDHDSLNRFDFCHNVTSKLFNVETDGATVIALNASWGTGKTQLCKMWGNSINKDEIGSGDFNAIYYSAWNNDDWYEALTPIVYTLADDRGKVEEVTQILETMAKTSTKNVLKFLGAFLLEFLSKQGVPVESLKSLKNYIGDSKEESEEELGLKVSDEYKNHLKAKNNLKNYLRGIGDRKIVFFVDELDRCKPTFAIETLEIIKHFFDLENFVFVLSLDLSELVKSIESVYGKNMNSTKYLAKFIDFRIDIPDLDYFSLKSFVIAKAVNINIEKKSKDIFIDALVSFYDENDFELRDVILSLNMVESFIKVYYNPESPLSNILEILTYTLLILVKYISIDQYKYILKECSLEVTNNLASIKISKNESYRMKFNIDISDLNYSVNFSNKFPSHFNSLDIIEDKGEIKALYKDGNGFFNRGTVLDHTVYFASCSQLLGYTSKDIYMYSRNKLSIGSVVMNKLEYFNKIETQLNND